MCLFWSLSSSRLSLELDYLSAPSHLLVFTRCCRSSNPQVMTGVSYVAECGRLIEPRSWFRTWGDIWVLALLAPAALSVLQIQRSSCRLNASINLYLPGRGIGGWLLWDWDFPETAGSALSRLRPAAEPPSDVPDVHNISGTRVRPFPSSRKAASQKFFTHSQLNLWSWEKKLNKPFFF